MNRFIAICQGRQKLNHQFMLGGFQKVTTFTPTIRPRRPSPASLNAKALRQLWKGYHHQSKVNKFARLERQTGMPYTKIIA